jgi:corrinoid protein of di/trimethylamine methyltransferase
VTEDLYSQMARAVVDGKAELAAGLAAEGLAEGRSPADILDKGFVKGIERVGELFGNGEYFLPELVSSAEAMEKAMAVLQPEFDKQRGGRQSLGRVMAGTVAGDLHDFGRMIVCSMLTAAGFTVSDVGSDVAVDTFVEKVRKEKPDLLLLSAMLTTTMPNQKKTIEALQAAGLRDSVKVMIGGGATRRAWAQEIGADGWAEDAVEAVDVAKQLVRAA